MFHFNIWCKIIEDGVIEIIKLLQDAGYKNLSYIYNIIGINNTT